MNDMSVINNEWFKAHSKEVFGDIDDFDLRSELAMAKMDRMRCPLSQADPGLYDEMQDALCDYCADQDLNPDDFDIEEIIF